MLKPNGAMQLMVYAPYGRTGIYMLQEFCSGSEFQRPIRRSAISSVPSGRRLPGIRWKPCFARPRISGMSRALAEMLNPIRLASPQPIARG